MNKLEKFVRQFRIVWHEGRCYAVRDGVLYSDEALARLATIQSIPARRKRVRELLHLEGARWPNSADLEGGVLGAFPMDGVWDGQYGMMYVVEDDIVFVPSEGEPKVGVHPFRVYRFSGAGEGRRLDLEGKEEDFWTYWEVATSPLKWEAKVSAAVMLPVLLGQASGGWIFVEGKWAIQAEVFSALIYLVWGRYPVPVGSNLHPMRIWSDAHLEYIAETGLVGVYKVGSDRKNILGGVASALERARAWRHRVGMVCGSSTYLHPNEAPTLLRVPLQKEKCSAVHIEGKNKEALAFIQPKALMGAFRLFQRAAKVAPIDHPVCSFSNWGSWALRYAEVLGVCEEVSAIFSDYVRASVADVSQLFALRQFFDAPQFEVGRKYTLNDIAAIGKLSETQVKELKRAMQKVKGQRLLDWVLAKWGVRFTIYPDTPTSPLYLSFHPLEEELRPPQT